jgi:hypothetical protein
MARKLRVEYPGAIYHVMNRGDRREPIFQDDANRQRFLVYERALEPQVAGSTKAGDLREERQGIAQRLFGFVENLVRKPGVFGA